METAPPPDDTTARVGEVLQGRYRLLAAIATGGMGSVYRGERVGLGRPVAIKFLQAGFARDPQLLQRFDVEARAMSRLSHPNCISVIDYGVEKLPYLVMDLAEGTPLRGLLDKGSLPARRAIAIARQVLAGLTHAHAQGIIHRDIKPENIIVDQKPGLDDHVRILDFGLAKLLDSQNNLTLGLAVGTPNYMSPEQMGMGKVGEHSDVYAMGVVLFEMLTGRKPFDHENVGEVFRRHMHMPPPPLRQAKPDAGFSAALEAVVLQAMAKPQAARFASAAAFAAALEATPESGRSPAAAPGEAPVPTPPPAPGGLDATAYVESYPGAIPPSSARASANEPARPSAGRQARAMSVVHSVIGRSPGAPESAGSTPRPTRRFQRRSLLIGGGTAATLALLLIKYRKPRPAAEPAIARSPAAASPPTRASTRSGDARGGSNEMTALMRAGDRDKALRLVSNLRRERPRDPELAALEAQLYFEKRWWSEGLSAFKDAVQNDPKRAGDPVLVRHVIRSLQSWRFHPKAAAFLRQLGDRARPLVEEAARSHDSHSVRSRAASLLQGWPRSDGGGGT